MTLADGIEIPDSKLAHEVTEIVRDTASELLFNHSTRVYFWAALTGERKGLKFDPELLYTGAMFHDIGLTERYRESQLRFEVDGANAARDFLRGRGIPEYIDPEVALVQTGAGMDITGRGYDDFTDEQRKAVIAAYPRGKEFEHEIIEAFYQGMKHHPNSTFGTINEDFLAQKDPSFQRLNICSIILGSRWTHCGCHAHTHGR